MHKAPSLVNIQRRNLSESQRAMIAARMAKNERGQFFGNQTVCADLRIPTQAQAAALLNVSVRLLQEAKVVPRDGAPASSAASP